RIRASRCAEAPGGKNHGLGARLARVGKARSTEAAALSRDPRAAQPGGLSALPEARDLVRDSRHKLSLGLRDRLAPDCERERTRLGLNGGAFGCGGTGQAARG